MMTDDDGDDDGGDNDDDDDDEDNSNSNSSTINCKDNVKTKVMITRKISAGIIMISTITTLTIINSIIISFYGINTVTLILL